MSDIHPYEGSQREERKYRERKKKSEENLWELKKITNLKIEISSKIKEERKAFRKKEESYLQKNWNKIGISLRISSNGC